MHLLTSMHIYRNENSEAKKAKKKKCPIVFYPTSYINPNLPVPIKITYYRPLVRIQQIQVIYYLSSSPGGRLVFNAKSTSRRGMCLFLRPTEKWSCRGCPWLYHLKTITSTQNYKIACVNKIISILCQLLVFTTKSTTQPIISKLTPNTFTHKNNVLLFFLFSRYNEKWKFDSYDYGLNYFWSFF